MVCPEWRQDLSFSFPFCSLTRPPPFYIRPIATLILLLFCPVSPSSSLSRRISVHIFFLHHNISPSIQFLPEYFPFRFYSCVILHPKRKNFFLSVSLSLSLSDRFRRLRLKLIISGAVLFTHYNEIFY